MKNTLINYGKYVDLHNNGKLVYVDLHKVGTKQLEKANTNLDRIKWDFELFIKNIDKTKSYVEIGDIYNFE